MIGQESKAGADCVPRWIWSTEARNHHRSRALRLIFVRGGLPTPETQIALPTIYGNARIRVDMGWPEWKVGVEYDGEQHWTDARQRAWDIERLVIAESEGWAIIRVSAEMMSRPAVVVERVATKLRQAGWPG